MYLRAGLISLVLLLASRVLGLARESVQAAAFGTTALGDLAVLMLTLPDIVTAILASGAMAYALLPWWAGLQPPALAASQRRTAMVLVSVGLAMAAALWLAPALVGGWLAPGLGPDMQPLLVSTVRWAAIAVPASLLASLWYTRLQHERDVLGMYGMNIVHTGVIVTAMLVLAWQHPANAIAWLGAALVLALGLRLLFLRWRLGRTAAQPAAPSPGLKPADLPAWSVWAWAVLAAGVPVAVPLLARSLVSQGGEGALSTFNYAWKLIELPNMLAVQLVATLAFPALTRARAEGRDFSGALRAAFLLAWTLAWAGTLALWLGAVPVARLLFGWGRMEPERVADVATWAALGGWTLPGQALVAVTVLVLATVGRLRTAALAYVAAFGGLVALGTLGLHGGQRIMQSLVVLFVALALLLLWSVRAHALRALAWRDMAVPALLCAVLAPLGRYFQPAHPMAVLAMSGVLAAALLGLTYAASPVLRATLKR